MAERSAKTPWILVTIVVAAILFSLVQGLMNVSVESFRITGIEDASTDSFTIRGELTVNNPAFLSVPVETVDYIIVLNRTDEVISSGNIDSFTLEARQTTEVPFNHETNWVPTASMAVQLLTQEHVYADVKGNATVDFLGITTYKTPFSKSFDIKSYVNRLIPGSQSTDTMDEVAEDTTGSTQNVVDQITS